MSWYPIEIRHTPTETDEQSAYDDLYNNDKLVQRDSHYLWFLKRLLHYAPPPAKLLDISCGEGDFLNFAQKAGYDALGIDFSIAAVQKSYSRFHESISALTANAQKLPFANGSFDVVTNIGSLEHYFDPEEAVSEMVRVLRPGGKALVLLPNAYGIFGNVWHVLKHGEVFDDGQPLQRYATRGSWEKLLKSQGLHTHKVLVLERPAPHTLHDFKLVLRRPHTLIRMIIGKFVPPNIGDLLVFVCSRDD
nr:class I SAM-dependent methyltransferase [Oscillochloris trichoides]